MSEFKRIPDEEIAKLTGHTSVKAMNFWNKSDVYRAIADAQLASCEKEMEGIRKAAFEGGFDAGIVQERRAIGELFAGIASKISVEIDTDQDAGDFHKAISGLGTKLWDVSKALSQGTLPEGMVK
jgi:hypothetical protein